MKKTLLALMMTAAVSIAGAMSLADANGKISAVIATPSEATAIMKQLSAADQKAFVASLNDAVNKLPGSNEEKAAKSLAVNRAAIRGAAKGNVLTLLAEICATASLEALTVINEVFAKDLLNRAADPSKVYTDGKFTELAKKVVEAVKARVDGTPDADVRIGFAALMMIRASNGSPSDLADTLSPMLGTSTATAKSEWFPAALAKTSDYEPMLAGTSVEIIPDFEMTLAMTGLQRHESIVAAVLSGKDSDSIFNDGFGDISKSIDNTDAGVLTVPRTTEDKPWNPEYSRGGTWNPEVPRGYGDQTF